MPITDLALELLHMCLSHLGRDDLRNTSLVCRHWLGPSMEYLWAQTHLRPNPYYNRLLDLGNLNEILNSNSNIPPILGSLTLDEGDVWPVYAKIWRESIPKILAHFKRIGRLFITGFNLTIFPLKLQRRMLNDITVIESLVIESLYISHVSDVTSFILDNPRLQFLKLDGIQIAKKRDRKNRNKTVDNGAVSVPVELGDFRVKLPNLRHLQYSTLGTQVDISTKLLSLLKEDHVKRLHSIVTDFERPNVLGELIQTAGSSLRSLGMWLYSKDGRLDLSKAESLDTLSLDICLYPVDDWILADLAYIIQNVANPKKIIINCKEGITMSGLLRHPDARSLWATIDNRLSNLESIEHIIFTQTIHPRHMLGTPMPGYRDQTFARLEKDFMKAARRLLPRCKEKGLLHVRRLPGDWRFYPFGKRYLPENLSSRQRRRRMRPVVLS